jgi:hypothetical protein
VFSSLSLHQQPLLADKVVKMAFPTSFSLLEKKRLRKKEKRRNEGLAFVDFL